MTDPGSTHGTGAFESSRRLPLRLDDMPSATPRTQWKTRTSAPLVLLLVFVCSALWACDAAPREDASSGPAAPAELEAELLERAAFDERFPRGLSADAKLETAEMLTADLAAPRHPSDGGGTARFADPEAKPRHLVSSTQRFEIVYEAGPLGISDGGQIIVQASPFWGWDSPQAERPDAPGYTEFGTDAPGITLENGDYHPDLLSIVIRGRRLEAGERIWIDFGAGPAGARVDRYAEESERIYISVDGDGDGVRSLIGTLPEIEIYSDFAQRIEVTWPTVALPGAPIDCVVAILDPRGNIVTGATGHVRLEFASGGAGPTPEAIRTIELEAAHRGRRTLRLEAPASGVHRVHATGAAGLEGIEGKSNPLVVRPGIEPLYWGDLHGHSQLSDGTGTPDQFYAYARTVAALDFAALTDHDHWGMRFLDTTPAMWSDIQESVERHHAPNRFVALLGYEWTSWLHGHRHVLYFGDEGAVYSSIDPATDSPDELWTALAGQPALTFAHHSAGGPVATNWQYPPDPVLEPLTEIVSVHGSSEAFDSPSRIYSPVPGNFVRDTLAAGYVFGFIGSSDSHDGHPGLAHRGTAPGLGGLAAVRAPALTREALLESLRARRTYATNGPRIYLEVRLGGRAMGSVVEAATAETQAQTLEIEVVATEPLVRVDLIRSGRSAELYLDGELHWRHAREIPPLQAGEYHYVRVVQADGGAAWSSPIYARVDPATCRAGGFATPQVSGGS